MEDSFEYDCEITMRLTSRKLRMAHKLCSDALDKWSGGHPDEQVFLTELKTELTKCILEDNLYL